MSAAANSFTVLDWDGDIVAEIVSRPDIQACLPMLTVYDHPSEHPDAFVARLWLTIPDALVTNIYLKAETLEGLRKMIPEGMVCLPRNSDDEPHIVEVWL